MIKKIFNSGNYPQNINYALLLMRLTIGAFMLTHGAGKLTKLFSASPIEFADPLGLGATFSLVLAVFSEFFCSILLIFGLATRLAGITLLITMLVAAFIYHANDGFGAQEKALLFSLTYLTIIITGAGKFSIDNWLDNKINHS